jgi:pyruvate formate lyase activating enzyme
VSRKLSKWFIKGTTEDSYICTLCPRGCCLSSGKTGHCYSRQAGPDGIELLNYGHPAGFAVDPIEKKPLYHFYPGSRVFSFGTVGCNMGCQFCQNWQLTKTNQRLSAGNTSPEEIATRAIAETAEGVAFTYNDPVVFSEYAIDVAGECRKRGLKTVAVSAGYICDEPRRELFSAIDAANIDLKSFNDAFYRKYCSARLGPVLDTLVYLASETRVWLEITTLLIPGLNDSNAEIEALTRWIAENLGRDVPLHFSAFHPDYKMLDAPPTSPSAVLNAIQIARSNGLKYVYAGNLRTQQGNNTCCTGCGSKLITRHGFESKITGLRRDECGNCGTKLAGHFA